ncbi:hypothetical protein [Aestuariivirga sp.]|uniref:hypothetical protein n=1 Tax=Aestuariivirga sp. TaxID=2650926 RepID=UPI0035944411
MTSSGKGGADSLSPKDFESIRDAVMETPRGRWFLTEYASRLRSSETSGLLDSMRRIESAVSANHDALMSRLAQAIAREPGTAPSTAPVVPQSDLAPKHMKFFRQDEEIFEPAPQAKIAAVPDAPKPEPKLDTPKGARVVIRRTEQASLDVEIAPAAPVASTAPVTEAAPPPVPQAAPETVTPAPQAEAPPKRRIVIIRHKPGEEIDVPLQNEMAEAS